MDFNYESEWEYIYSEEKKKKLNILTTSYQ